MSEHIIYNLVKSLISSINDLLYREYITKEEHNNMLKSIPDNLVDVYLKWKEFDN